MKPFGSFGAFLAYFVTVQASVGAAQRRGLDEGARLIEREAKDLIGTEYAGWSPLADATVEEKRRLGYTGRDSPTDPLYRTGEMRASIQHRVDETSAVIGTDDPVAEHQEYGTDHIPARPFLAPAAFRKGEAAADEIAKAVGYALAGATVPTSE